ncbi:hypothetical protein BJ508DRAFT_315211 [Ascobolus immersus RN42]|uniref:Uncharacterized protein n=1 Tax=Ascobolus immersus RN42 TaxID=1160509 RepID=A0A3N4HHZ2_ASCIM|nr:hypothetical protein BJ508DRAFT_315211 [Ascobolus immersus RN42]
MPFPQDDEMRRQQMNYFTFGKLIGKQNFAIRYSSIIDELKLTGCYRILDGSVTMPDKSQYNIPEIPTPPLQPPPTATAEEREEYDRLSVQYRTDLNTYKLAYDLWSKAFKYYDHLSKKCTITIKRTLSEHPLSRVLNCYNPVKIWQTLEAAYKDEGIAASMVLVLEIMAMKYDGVSDFSVFLDKFISKLNHLILLDLDLRKREKIQFLLNAMPETFGVFIGTFLPN